MRRPRTWRSVTSSASSSKTGTTRSRTAPGAGAMPRSGSSSSWARSSSCSSLGLPVIVCLAGVGGYVLARRALAPIDHLAAEARRITADRLHERLSVPNEHDEIGTAGGRHQRNVRPSGIVVRSAAALHRRRVARAADAAVGDSRHRRAGPRRDADAPRNTRRRSGSMLEEVDRLTRLVDTLLRLSRGDAGHRAPVAESPSISADLARDVASSLAILAEERRQRLHVAAADRFACRPIVWCCGMRSPTSSTTQSSTDRRHRRSTSRGERGRDAGGAERSPMKARASRPSIASGSSTGSTAIDEGRSGDRAAPGSAWRSRNGQWKQTGAVSHSRVPKAVQRSGLCCHASDRPGASAHMP